MGLPQLSGFPLCFTSVSSVPRWSYEAGIRTSLCHNNLHTFCTRKNIINVLEANRSMCTITKDAVKVENNLEPGCLDPSMLGQNHWSLTCEDTGYKLQSHVDSLITNVMFSCGSFGT